MDDALYGPGGFYRSVGAPGRHFRTAAHTGSAWAAALVAFVTRTDKALGRPDGFAVVDMGAGGGEMLAGMAALAPARWSLIGVDVAPRPPGLPSRVDWRSDLPTSFVGALLAVEWLDVVPVDVVERTEHGLQIVEVDVAGRERLGRAATDEERDWLARWWPLDEVGDRAEVGHPRDEAWRDAASRVEAGVALAVDYAVVPARDVAGTLTGFKEGRQALPVPDGSMDITAHVLFESLAADGELVSQRDALRELGVEGRRPAYAGDPGSYLTDLSRAGDEAELLDPSGLGAFTWLVQAVQGSPT